MKMLLIVLGSILGAAVTLSALAAWLLIPNSSSLLLAIAGIPVFALLVLVWDAQTKLKPKAPSAAPSRPAPMASREPGSGFWGKTAIWGAGLAGLLVSSGCTAVIVLMLLPGDSKLPNLPMTGASKANEEHEHGMSLFRATTSFSPCSTAGLKAFASAVRLRPDDAKYRNSYGVGLMRCGHLDNAILEFNAALRIDPTFSKASGNLTTANRLRESRQAAEIAQQLGH